MATQLRNLHYMNRTKPRVVMRRVAAKVDAKMPITGAARAMPKPRAIAVVQRRKYRATMSDRSAISDTLAPFSARSRRCSCGGR